MSGNRPPFHLVDVTMFYAPESGGVKRYLTTKQQWFQKQGTIRHTIVVPGPASGHVHASQLELRSPRIPLGHGYRLPIATSQWRDALVNLRPDVIEAGDPYHLAWAVLAAGKRLGIPVAAFYHSDLPRMIQMRFGKWGGKGAERYIRNLYSRFELVLAPSLTMVNRLRELGINQSRHQPLGVDTATFKPDPDKQWLRTTLGLRPDQRLLIYVGRYSREKNLPTLLHALKQLGNTYHLLLVGSGSQPGQLSNVTYWPYQQSTSDLAKLLAASDVFVHPGDKETFGLVVLEALACGIPVVGVEGGAVQELIDPGVGVLARPHDPASLAEAIHALFDQELTVLSNNARQKVVNHYQWDRVLNRLFHYYTTLIESAASSPNSAVIHASE